MGTIAKAETGTNAIKLFYLQLSSQPTELYLLTSTLRTPLYCTLLENEDNVLPYSSAFIQVPKSQSIPELLGATTTCHKSLNIVTHLKQEEGVTLRGEIGLALSLVWPIYH